ncbi:MAG: cadmium-translocating P-type ATPase [Phycisphaerales bacterium]|nr:cadmium-translocating P-type ATPase [Phycisphaerales bacterium]
MAHDLIGIKKHEAEHHAHHHHHGASDHFHEHAHGDAASAAKSATIWLFVTLLGGVLIITSYIIQFFSPYSAVDKSYLYADQIDFSAMIGAILLAVRVIWHALKNLLSGHMHMDELVALAIAFALATGDYRVAGIVAFFLLVSELIESRTAIGARASIEELVKLTPKTARLIEGGTERVVDATALKPGQKVRVMPGDNIPADGRVAHGESTVNQANITGESLPVDKREGDQVFSGTTNLTGAMEIEVTKVGADTTLGQVQHLILDAERTKIPIMRLIDRYVIWYTPIVLMIAGIVLFFTKDENGLQRAISMLVVSCPCALIMATPTAMVAGLSAAARLGILIKDVSHLESAGRLTSVIFDKTGTLTTGELSVTRLVPAEGVSGADLLRLAASAEQNSNHPAARALMSVAREANVSYVKPEKFEEVPGKGVLASVEGSQIIVGRETFLREKNIDTSSVAEISKQMEGMSQLFVARGNQILGLVGLEDRTRSAAQSAVQELRDIGINRVAMLTGDRAAVARRVAAEMNCTEFKADCLPHEKLELVEAMRRQGHRVMVVGDGVNDAPALAAGDLGMAMGAAGSDVAIKSASIALLNNDLTRIPFLVRLSRETRSVVIQNLVFGVLFVIVMMTLGAFNIVSPITAAVAHALSSFFVVFNSARLVRMGEEKLTHTQVIAEEAASRRMSGSPAVA